MSSIGLSQEEAISRLESRGFEALEPFTSTKTRWRVRHLSCGSETYVRLGSLATYRGGCSECRNSTIGYSESDAEEIMKNANLKPVTSFVSALTKWESKCTICGSDCAPKLVWIIQGQGGCKKCGYANRRRTNLPKTHRSTRKKTAIEAKNIFDSVGRTPLEPYPGLSTRPWKSKCNKCGLIGSPTLSTVLKRQNSQCENCGRKRTANSKKLSQETVSERFGRKKLELLDLYKHDNTEMLRVRCLLCDREIEQSLLGIAKVKIGCKYCSGTFVDPADARKLMLDHGYDPQEPYKGTDTNWKCIHVICGKPCNPRYGTIKRGEGGCKNCADWGYSTRKPSYLYFIEHKSLGALKVGIGNVGKTKKVDRLSRHVREGWVVIKVWNFETGETPLAVESEFFREIRRKREIPQHLRKGVMKYQGETETFAVGSIRNSTVVNFINKAIIRRGAQG